MSESQPESEHPQPYREVVNRDALGKIMPPTEFPVENKIVGVQQ